MILSKERKANSSPLMTHSNPKVESERKERQSVVTAIVTTTLGRRQ